MRAKRAANLAVLKLKYEKCRVWIFEWEQSKVNGVVVEVGADTLGDTFRGAPN
tara:strand:+ start:423 stop:581 length:159 start_codon:yes stop_codon:yes gene_type:complete